MMDLDLRRDRPKLIRRIATEWLRERGYLPPPD